MRHLFAALALFGFMQTAQAQTYFWHESYSAIETMEHWSVPDRETITMTMGN